MRMFRALERSQVPAFGRDDPQAAGATDKDVSRSVHLDTVNGVLTRRAGHIEEQFTFAEGAIGRDRVAVDYLVLVIPITHIEESLVRGEGEAVRPGEVIALEPHFSIPNRIDP